MTPHSKFAGRTALVTGGASGLGRAMAEALAATGASLVLFDLNHAQARGLASDLKAKHWIRAEAVEGSVTNSDDVARGCRTAIELTGRLDIVMNNAGIVGNAPSIDLDEATWRRVIDVNLTGVFLVAQAAARIMIPQGGGSIVNTTSMYGVAAAPGRASYCASKAGVVGLTKVLAIEWAASGVRVNAIGPGYVRTPLTEQAEAEGKLDFDALARRIPAGRLAMPAEIAASRCFLLPTLPLTSRDRP